MSDAPQNRRNRPAPADAGAQGGDENRPNAPWRWAARCPTPSTIRRRSPSASSARSAASGARPCRPTPAFRRPTTAARSSTCAAASSASSCRRRPTPRARRPASRCTTPASASPFPLEDVNAILPRLKEGDRPQARRPRRQHPDAGPVHDASRSFRPSSRVRPPTRPASGPATASREIDGKPVETQVQLQMRLGSKYEGDVIAVKIERDGKEIDLQGRDAGRGRGGVRPGLPRRAAGARRPRPRRRSALRLSEQSGRQGRRQGRRPHHPRSTARRCPASRPASSRSSTATASST